MSLNSNRILLYRNQSIIMLRNQIDSIVNVGVNFIGLFEYDALHYKRLRWWPRIWHILYVTLRLFIHLLNTLRLLSNSSLTY
jgi:hypothetical protein